MAVFSADRAILDFFVAHRSAAITDLAQWMAGGDGNATARAMFALLVLAVLAMVRQWRAVLSLPLAYLSARLLATGLKELLEVDRPSRKLVVVFTGGYSFPSDHAAFTAAVAMTLLLTVDWPSPQVRRAAAVLAMVCVAAIGILMIYAGAHWTSDVIVGWALGAGIGWLVSQAAEGLVPHRKSSFATWAKNARSDHR